MFVEHLFFLSLQLCHESSPSMLLSMLGIILNLSLALAPVREDSSGTTLVAWLMPPVSNLLFERCLLCVIVSGSAAFPSQPLFHPQGAFWTGIPLSWAYVGEPFDLFRCPLLSLSRGLQLFDKNTLVVSQIVPFALGRLKLRQRLAKPRAQCSPRVGTGRFGMG